ncbi:Rho guanine nucleotide exchange factor [Blastocystis sp. ATCC 50177/Nand II]|uniref:Rho guanine nucleotide exchange factor n=1 Tax=Blastocystis sp. subtype 1 (strain ATCC 50177 / NandII) TaxID=478820 RepID=A0A196SAA8_BLAHN|nr:Rho guanine nucleotide exchange factor [Blastocystis sp. ATCC 50177/Nand II]
MSSNSHFEYVPSSNFVVPDNLEEQLTAFYQAVNPEKVDKVHYAMDKYKGREEDLFHILYNKYGKQPWSLEMPAQTTAMDDFSRRLRALRSNVWGIVVALTTGETIEPDDYNTCKLLQEQLKERDATIKELHEELDKAENKHSLDSDDDNVSVALSEAASEIFTTEQNVLEASPVPMSVSQRLDAAISTLQSGENTSPEENAVCSFAVADLKKWKSIIEKGIKSKPMKMDMECKYCKLCRQPFTSFRRRHHCRLCGDLFCSNCCNSYLSVNQLGENKRFCNECYLLLNKVKQLSNASKNSGK